MNATVQVGSRIRIYHQLEREGESAIGVVKALLKDGHVKATLEDEDHELYMHNDKVRELIVSPDLYEVVA